MPIGVIVNVLAVVLGGVLGSVAGSHFSDELKTTLNMIFGLCAMTMGIKTIPGMANMPAVIMSVILGTIIGVLIHLTGIVNKGAGLMKNGMSKLVKTPSSVPKEEYDALFLTVLVLFCASGSGIYGSIISGMTGDHSMLISKSILDFFTAAIFAVTLGPAICMVGIPQLVIFLLLFFLADLIYPHTTPSMIADFNACGGMLLVATGFRMLKVKMFPTADMIPAMILVMPVSWLWTTLIVPMIG